ncbi:hypothetical protein AAVH_21721 [Aphelenchoides avenae]|nr:hypothetical protein AAVH_21721 [Aphelenchus avenae]
MADGNTSPAQRGRGLLALNITDGRRFLVGGGSKESRAVSVCGFTWKFETRVSVYGRGRNKASVSTLRAVVSCSVVDPQNPIDVKAKCRWRVRHATHDGLEKAWTNSLRSGRE